MAHLKPLIFFKMIPSTHSISVGNREYQDSSFSSTNIYIYIYIYTCIEKRKITPNNHRDKQTRILAFTCRYYNWKQRRSTQHVFCSPLQRLSPGTNRVPNSVSTIRALWSFPKEEDHHPYHMVRACLLCFALRFLLLGDTEDEEQ